MLPAFPAGGGAGQRSSHELGSLNAGWGWNSGIPLSTTQNCGARSGVPGERFGDAAEGREEALSPFCAGAKKIQN